MGKRKNGNTVKCPECQRTLFLWPSKNKGEKIYPPHRKPHSVDPVMPECPASGVRA